MSVLDSHDAPPAKVIDVKDESVGLDGVVVIDHELFPTSAGGTRMVPDVTTEEVARLARAMTWKFAVCGVPYAGAKAGIRFGGGGDRRAVLEAFLDRVGELDFLTGPDMGTNPDDFLRYAEGDGNPMWARSHEGMGMDDLAVGHGILGAARVALEHVATPLRGATAAIEGFGKAGAGTARALSRAGVRIVAVSTIEGAIVDPEGLDAERLIALRNEHGDRLVHHAGPEVRRREALFAVECDVLVPGARPDVITRESAAELRCATIVPIANIPYAPGSLDALHACGIIALPDFVTNAGGVHLYEAPECKESPAECLRGIERLIGDTTARVLELVDTESVTPTDAALSIAREFLRAARP